MRAKALSPDLVRTWFAYSDGVVYWADSPHSRIKVGVVAGFRKQYHVITFRCVKYPRAHLVWTLHHGKWPLGHVAHLNGDPFDDRPENLADSAVVPQGIGSLPAGVQRSRGKYMARITDASYQPRYLGTFDTAEQAHEAFKSAHVILHGMHSPYASGV